MLSIDTVKEMNAMCNIDEQRKQAVKEFAEKLKNMYVDKNLLFDGYFKIIDALLKDYEDETNGKEKSN